MANSTRLVGLKKDNDVNKQLYDDLFVNDSNYRLISSSPKVFSAIHPEDFGDNFYLSEEELDYYIDGFIEAVTENVDTLTQAVITEQTDNSALESGIDDFDIKLSLYRSFKSLYDKWISNSEYNGVQTNGYFFNNYGRDDNRMLYEHFRFINRANQDIGKKAVIDFTYLSNLADTKNGQGPTQSLYESLTGVLSKNNFDFWPLPAEINLSTESLTDEEVKDMFRPLTIVKELKPGPVFACVYIGGSSRSLADLNNDTNTCNNHNSSYYYNDDSFDITEKTDWPTEYASTDGGIVAFKVRYGQEAQNHFNSIELDQTEFKETQESLQIIDSLTNPNSGSNPNKIGKGNNMYDVYLTRSYTCKVSGLGNMSIQPLMHFKLENVPMFRGTYLVMGVSHRITPHNIITEFSGMRQPKITVPVVTEALSLLDIALAETAPPAPAISNLVGGETPLADSVVSGNTSGISLNPEDTDPQISEKFNFHKIPDNLNNYRSAQITIDTLPNVIKTYGIKTIVRFNGDSGSDARHRSSFPVTIKSEEERICKENGCNFVFVNAHDGYQEGKGYVKSIEKVTAELKKGNTLIHCAHGADRTGYLVASYLQRTGIIKDKDKLWEYTVQYNSWTSYIQKGKFFGTGYAKYADGFYPISELKNSKWA